MTRLVLVLVRLMIRWLAVPVLTRWVMTRLTRRSVARATIEVEQAAERLGAPVAATVRALPAEVRTAAGSALVAGRVARRSGETAVVTARAARSVQGASRRAGDAVGERVRLLAAVPDEVRAETESARRRLRSRYLAATSGPDAATDALLDLRPDSGGADRPDPHDLVPAPVPPGRPRARSGAGTRPDRPSRRYRPPSLPW